MAMNIQIFGTNKSFDTKKAQRWFKERGIRFQMIDLAVKGMSRGEFESVCRAVGGWEALFDPDSKDKQNALLIRYAPEEMRADMLLENPKCLKSRPRWATAPKNGKPGNKLKKAPVQQSTGAFLLGHNRLFLENRDLLVEIAAIHQNFKRRRDKPRNDV